MRINHNISSLTTQGSLFSANRSMAKNLEKLSILSGSWMSKQDDRLDDNNNYTECNSRQFCFEGEDGSIMVLSFQSCKRIKKEKESDTSIQRRVKDVFQKNNLKCISDAYHKNFNRLNLSQRI